MTDTRPLRPMVLCVIAGLGVSFFASLALKIVVGFAVVAAGQPTTGALWLTLALIVVVLAEGSGGFASARLAGSRGMVAAVSVGVVNLILATAAVLLGPGTVGWLWLAASLVLVLPAAALGGWVARERA